MQKSCNKIAYATKINITFPFQLFFNLVCKKFGNPWIKIFEKCNFLLTVHLCGFSPVCLLICTTNIYCALNGFSLRLQFSHRQTKLFLFAWIWSLLICLTKSSWVGNSVLHSFQWQFVSIKSPGSSRRSAPSELGTPSNVDETHCVCVGSFFIRIFLESWSGEGWDIDDF